LTYLLPSNATYRVAMFRSSHRARNDARSTTFETTAVSMPVRSVSTPDFGGLRVMIINPPRSYPVELSFEYQSYFPVHITSLDVPIEPTGATIRLLACFHYDLRYRDTIRCG
jgi:hypothetical protein